MSDEELSRRVALARGWKRAPEYGPTWWLRPLDDGRTTLVTLPDFARSLDACFGPGGPVEYAKAMGWGIELDRYVAQWGAAFILDQGGARQFAYRYDDNPARALCLAFLAACEAQP